MQHDLLEADRLPNGRTKPSFPEAVVPQKQIRSELFLMSYKMHEHLLVVMAFEPTIHGDFWKSEICGFITPFERLVTKSGKRAIKAKNYFDNIWDGPVEPEARSYVGHIVDGLAEAKPDLKRNGVMIGYLVERIKAFHRAIGEAIEHGRPIEPIVNGL